MKKLLISLILALSGIFLFQGVLATGVSAEQFDPLAPTCNAASDTQEAQAICDDSTDGADRDPINGDGGVIADVANLLALAGGVIAVFIIVIAGITMMTSGGDAGKVSSSRNAIIYAAVGLVVIVLARTIVVFIFDRLVN
jgi:hypothetical protein